MLSNISNINLEMPFFWLLKETYFCKYNSLCLKKKSKFIVVSNKIRAIVMRKLYLVIFFHSMLKLHKLQVKLGQSSLSHFDFRAKFVVHLTYPFNIGAYKMSHHPKNIHMLEIYDGEIINCQNVSCM